MEKDPSDMKISGKLISLLLVMVLSLSLCVNDRETPESGEE